ncbi:hypothetical protein [Oceanobacillus kimchii]|uniref:Uncharacterized protein n=1 Tax=Oceanobacillus kimchii TaxID=746691 RepID=A0ABQ5TRP6_9BACI|nr:hypothetical protein [Oceanobacillus kimchii]GLO68479.1 hypothetical protein MACH08_42630 [Oceanobacillus kimchii]
MIQVIGSSDIYSTNGEISMSFVEDNLNDKLVKFDVISESTTQQESRVTIKFIMNMNKIVHCITLEDYNSHIFKAFNSLLPGNLYAQPVMVYKIIPIKGEPIKHFKDHMVEHENSILFNT